MKKHEIKSGRTKPPEVRTREQIENETFNRMLLWVAVAAVVEVVMGSHQSLLYQHQSERAQRQIVLYYVLTALPFVGAAPVRDPLGGGRADASKRYREGRNLQVAMASDFCAWACAAF